MFCIKCGKEVDEKWEKCPYCGNVLQNQNVFEEGVKKNKNTKKRIPLIIAGIIGAIIILIVLLCVIGGTDSTKNTISDVSGENVKQAVALSTYEGGYAGWEAQGFPGSVTTEITIPHPLENTEFNNYAVYIGVGKIHVGVIMQENEASMSEWDWLMKAEPDYDTGEYYFNCTLTYTGQNVGEAEFPLFIISDVETTMEQRDGKLPLSQLDMADYVGGDIQTLLAKCSDIVEDEAGMMYSDVTGNIIITEMDSIIDTVIIEESADAPSFAGISIGDNIYELEGANLESYGYSHVAESEGIIGYGHSDGSAGVMFAVDAEGYVLSISWMNNLLETMEISAEMDEDVLISSAKDENDLTGTYVDEELGEKIVIIQEDNLVTYKYCGLDDTSPIIETNCTVESDYINGQYYYISKNMDGTLALSSGVGGSWGNFVKVDNEAIIELEESGDVGLSYDLGTDVENGLLYSDENGNIIDKNGNIIPEYSDLTVLENGYIFDGECALEGFFSGAGGKLVYHIY